MKRMLLLYHYYSYLFLLLSPPSLSLSERHPVHHLHLKPCASTALEFSKRSIHDETHKNMSMPSTDTFLNPKNFTSNPPSPDDVAHMDILDSSPTSNQGSHKRKGDSDDADEEKIRLPLVESRNLIFQLGGFSGDLCKLAFSFPLQSKAPFLADSELRQCCALLLWHLLRLSVLCRLDIETCIHKKMDLNRKKYPVDLCKVSAMSSIGYMSCTFQEYDRVTITYLVPCCC